MQEAEESSSKVPISLVGGFGFMHANPEEKDSLNSGESECSRHVKSVIRVPQHRQSPAPWDTDIGNSPSKRARTEPMRDSHGQSQEPDDQSRHSVRDRSGSGRRDALRRGRLFTELVFIDTTSMVMAHPARILLGPRPHKAGLPWIVLLGPFPQGNSLPRTPLLLGLDPPGNDLPRTTVLLCVVTLVPPGTSLPLIRLLLGLTPLPGEELSWSTSVLLGPVPMRAGLLWMQVQLGLVLPGTSLPQTGLGALPGLPPPGRKLPQARSQVLLGCLLQEFRLPQTFMWVMGPLIKLATHLGLPPCGQQLLGTRSAVLLGCVPRRSGYRERSDWGRFLGEPD